LFIHRSITEFQQGWVPGVVGETHGTEVTFPWTVDLIGAVSVTAPIFYGGAIAGMGFLTIYYRDFPLYTIAPSHSEIPGQ